jgi:long-chain fatty acid transport protein
MRKPALALALGSSMTCLLGCPSAKAGGFQIGLSSAALTSRGLAGSASAAGDAAVVNNNPAAMTLFGAPTVQSDAFVNVLPPFAIASSIETITGEVRFERQELF